MSSLIGWPLKVRPTAHSQTDEPRSNIWIGLRLNGINKPACISAGCSYSPLSELAAPLTTPLFSSTPICGLNFNQTRLVTFVPRCNRKKCKANDFYTLLFDLTSIKTKMAWLGKRIWVLCYLDFNTDENGVTVQANLGLMGFVYSTHNKFFLSVFLYF